MNEWMNKDEEMSKLGMPASEAEVAQKCKEKKLGRNSRKKKGGGWYCVSLLGLCDKVIQTWCLQQQTFVVSQSWRPECKIKLWAELVPSVGCEEESVAGLSPSLCWLAGSLWCPLAWRYIILICLHLHVACSLWASLCPVFHFYKDTNHVGLGPTLMT